MVAYQRVSKNGIASPLQLNTKQNLTCLTATPHTNPAIISCNGPTSKRTNYEAMNSVTTTHDTTVNDPATCDTLTWLSLHAASPNANEDHLPNWSA